ncbi:MAG: SAM-dependent methyltransferase, partial [Cyanobacteriota bacterium]|nr:SAM-dependent methyltransferase [Cyanobacteriota bacterium]
PQFEVGRERVGKGGVVRDSLAHVDALKSVIDTSRSLGWWPKGLIASPITGPAGNHEYLLWLGDETLVDLPVLERLVAQTLA